MQSLARGEPEQQQESEQHNAQLAQAVVEREGSQAASNVIDAHELVTRSVSEKDEPIVSAVALQKDEKDPEFVGGQEHGFGHDTSSPGRGRGKARHRGSRRKGGGPERCSNCGMISHRSEDCLDSRK
jgi:hypothetical protein